MRVLELTTFALAVAFLISTAHCVNDDVQVNSLRTVFSCTSDTDCHHQGKCDSSGTCSCYSGFGNTAGNYDCAIAPSATCSSSYNNISSLGASFSPSLTVNVANSILSFGISVPLEFTQFINSWDSSSSLRNSSTSGFSMDTTISFGNSTGCNYPPLPSSSAWTKDASSSGACKDQYQFAMAWADAKTACGFTYDSVSKSWVQEVTMTRYYSIPFDTSVVDDQKRSAFTRSESSTQFVRIEFPESVDVSTDVTVTGPSALSSTALSSVTYVPSDNAWRVDVMVATAKPYKLASPSASVTGISSDRVLGSRTAIADQSACNSNGASCTQKISVFISQCSALTGQVVLTLNAVCSGGADGATCVNVPGQITITANMDTDSSCDVLNNITLQSKALTAYTSSAMDVVATGFGAGETAYFGASITSSDATIQSRSVVSVCFILDPSSGNTDCVPFDFKTLASPNATIDPAFSVDLSQTRALTNDSSAETFKVKVTFAISWDAASSMKRVESSTGRIESVALIRVSQNNATSTHSVLPASDAIASDADDVSGAHDNYMWKVITIAAASVGGAIVVGVAIVLSLIYRKRLQVRQAERAFNFSQLN